MPNSGIWRGETIQEVFVNFDVFDENFGCYSYDFNPHM
jgi:hypothetical protein